MKALGKMLLLTALVASAAGCVTTSAVAVKSDGTVYVVRGERVYACNPQGASALSCAEVATVK